MREEASRGCEREPVGQSLRRFPDSLTVTSYVLPSTPAQALPWPVNVGVAPDGQTVIVCYARDDSVGVYQVTSPGILTFRGNVSGLPVALDAAGNVVSGEQSVAFSADGSQAYIITNELHTPPPEFGELPDRISVLNITAPGEVSLNTAGAAILLNHSSVGTPPLYGVDVLAVAGSKLYVGNPTTDDPVNDLQVVDLTDYSVSSLPVGALEGESPMGVAAFAPAILTVETAGAGAGWVSGDPTACDPGGVYCGADCTETYCTGTVTAIPATRNFPLFVMRPWHLRAYLETRGARKSAEDLECCWPQPRKWEKKTCQLPSSPKKIASQAWQYRRAREIAPRFCSR